MSEEDRRKWDDRYAEGAYQGRRTASVWLQRWLPEAPMGRALDVACGLGRNARYMAEQGFRVDAVDISAEGLRRAEELAQAEGLKVRWLQHDLDEGLPDGGPYELIAMFRYVNGPLLQNLKDRLAPGGYLIVEQHLVTDASVAGPRNPSFRVRPGELEQALTELRLLAVEESVTRDPDGERVALARVAARRTVDDRRTASD